MVGKPDPLIECENLVKIYKVADLEVVALQGLDLMVKRGEMLGIVGASGSGKSTLMNILGGLDRPSAGRVMVDGINLLSLSEPALNEYQRTKVGFVWQQTSRNLISYLTALENIEMPMTMFWGISAKEKKGWALELLSAIGLYERRDHHLGQLSGGEQQRVAIAVALANKPVLLLGDEPTGEVDSATAQIVMDTFRKLGKLMDLTIIIVTHDPRVAGQTDRVVAIRDGKISTETVRRVTPAINQASIDVEASALGAGNVTFHEYVVLDSAGRLQLPKEVLADLGIGKHAQLERRDDYIIVRAAEGEERSTENTPLSLEEQLALFFKDQIPPTTKNRRGLRDRLGLGRQK